MFSNTMNYLMPWFILCSTFSQCKDHYQCLYWLPLLSLTLSDFFCSCLVICGSLLAVLGDGQISPWCEVVSLLKFTFITSSIGSIGMADIEQFIELIIALWDIFINTAFIVNSNKGQYINSPLYWMGADRCVGHRIFYEERLNNLAHNHSFHFI